MKPYFRVIINWCKLNLIALSSKSTVEINKIPLLGYNTRVVQKKNSHLYVGDRVQSDGRLSIILDQNSKLILNKYVYFNEDCMISVKSEVNIGSNCKFGPGVKIFDNNHLFTRESGVSGKCSSAPIMIGENTWIGANCVILKGVTIGRNCVIGAGCVIRENIPDYSIVTLEHNLKIREMKD